MAMKYSLVCGLEIHAELNTMSKMFCACKNDPFGAQAPNVYTCPVCLGLPGGLPVANKAAIKKVVQLGLALGCKIHQFSKFDRKNYFYPDLAKGYQISQYDLPFCYEGRTPTGGGGVRLTRIHMEEDTGKLSHIVLDGEKVSLIDFNRSGVPLAEIVSEPDITSSEQAVIYAKYLRETMRYLGIANCDMEKGGMRLEANISLQTPEQKEKGELPKYKVEVKNINSFNFMKQAIEYEMKRQAAILDKGELPKQETRGFNSETNKTFSQREKEDAADYRYFPDPDLPPIEISDELLASWKKEIPELKVTVTARWQKKYGIEERYSELLLENRETESWWEELWREAEAKKIEAGKLANFLANKKIAFKVPDEPREIIKKFLEMNKVDEVSDEEIEKIVRAVAKENAEAVAKYQAGQKQVVGFFMGQIMKKAGKKLDIKVVNETLRRVLGD
jgi:aspartyl-tRNA(Asn)/glutamyl-tRNA(Gln) amidotransferase subunit B